MGVNQNGLLPASWVSSVSNNYKQISEGQVVAIAFGWIIAVILLYILGVIIIIKCVPLRREDERSQEDHSGGSKGKEANGKSSLQKESGLREEQEGQGKRKRRILESNPTTLEMMESEKPSNILAFNVLTSNQGRE